MAALLHRSHNAASDTPPHAPGQWQDLKRDWRRWSRAERLAAECALGVAVICAAAALAGYSFL